jgi:hypothetical protein
VLILARTDYQIACTLECDPIVQGRQEVVGISKDFPVELNSPFLLSNSGFLKCAAVGMSEAACTLLNDVRFITTSMLSLSRPNNPGQARNKFLATVQWNHTRLTADIEISLANDMIYQTCRAAATIYTTAILSRKPLSEACTSSLLSDVWKTMWRVPLSRWKQIPGVFLFVLLVVNPFTRSRPEGRFIKGMFAPSIIAIGFVDWEVVAAILKAFLGVQRWLRGDNEVRLVVVEDDRLAVSRAPEGGLPSWALTR